MHEGAEVCAEGDPVAQDFPGDGRLLGYLRFVKDERCDECKAYNERREHLRRVPREADATEGESDDGERCSGDDNGVTAMTMIEMMPGAGR